MSILSVMPCNDWYYEPPDEHLDLDDDAPDWPVEAVTFTVSGFWWSAAAVTDDDE